MSNKNSSDGSVSITDEVKEQSNKYNLSKFDYDLYKEEDNVSEKVVRVKRVNLPNNGERWKIFIDNKITFIVEGSKLTKKEKEFLQTVAGVNFILMQAKSGITSLNKFRNELKNKMNQNVSDGILIDAVQKQRRCSKKQKTLLSEK